MFNRVAHIGFPKSASTFLQRNVFGMVSGYTNIDFFECKNISLRIIRSGPFLDLDSIAKSLPVGNIIFSYEGLVGNFLNGIGINSISTTMALKTLGFNRIIVVTRNNKEAWLKSIYNHYVRGGGRLNFKDFVQNPHNSLQSRQWYPEMMENADNLIEEYRKIFGASNVLHLRSEDLYKDLDGFKNVLEGFLQTKIDISNDKYNESIPDWMIRVLLFTNNFTHSILNPTSLFKHVSSGYVKKILFFFSSKTHSKFK